MAKYSLKQVIGTLTDAERTRLTVTVNDLPGRLSTPQAARVLGFPVEAIAPLIECKLLEPLGDPAPNAHKFFPNIYIRKLADDVEWLDKATQALYEYWQQKNQRKRANQLPAHTAEQNVALAA